MYKCIIFWSRHQKGRASSKEVYPKRMFGPTIGNKLRYTIINRVYYKAKSYPKYKIYQ